MMYHVRLFVLNDSSEFDPMDPDDLISLGEARRHPRATPELGSRVGLA